MKRAVNRVSALRPTDAALAHFNLPKSTTAKLAAAPNREAAVTGSNALCSVVTAQKRCFTSFSKPPNLHKAPPSRRDQLPKERPDAGAGDENSPNKSFKPPTSTSNTKHQYKQTQEYTNQCIQSCIYNFNLIQFDRFFFSSARSPISTNSC